MADADKTYQEQLKALREKALARLSQMRPDNDSPLSPETDKLLQDLNVHQIELELQNEELREAQLELQRSRDRYLDLYHHAPVGYVVTDAAGIVIQANQTLAGMLNQDMGDLVNRPLAGIIHPDDQDIFYARFRAFYKNPGQKSLYVQIAGKAGTAIQAKMEGRRIDGSGDKVGQPRLSGHLLITISDVTQAKMAEQAIVRAKKQWEQTFDAVPELIAIIDNELNVVRVNKAMANRLSLSPAECVGKKCYQLLHEDELQPVHCPHQRFLQTGLASKVERYSQKLDGHFITSVSPFHYNNSQERWCIHISHDITDRKQAERELMKSRNLESLGTLAGGIAHDVNNLLTALVGNIDLAQLHLDNRQKLSAYLEESMQAAFRVRDLANRLVTFAEGGAPHVQPVPVRRLVEDVVRLGLKGAKVQCRINLPPDLRAMVVDEVQIKTALRNVIDNAREAMPEGGLLEITARNGTDKASQADPYLQIDIRDEGVGIASDHLGQIFDPYFSTKQMGAKKGMGLGLAITHSIIKKHNGQITARSHTGQGTTISIRLPAEPGWRPAAQPEETFCLGRTGQAARRLLLMESETSLWELIAKMLYKMGVAVDCAADSQTAMDLFQRSRLSGKAYDAVILGLATRDGIGGKEVVRQMLAIDPNVKAAVFSVHADDPVFVDYKRYGFSASLRKPFELKSLAALIAELVGTAGAPSTCK